MSKLQDLSLVKRVESIFFVCCKVFVVYVKLAVPHLPKAAFCFMLETTSLVRLPYEEAAQENFDINYA